jgi:hypothetical protein
MAINECLISASTQLRITSSLDKEHLPTIAFNSIDNRVLIHTRTIVDISNTAKRSDEIVTEPMNHHPPRSEGSGRATAQRCQ